MNKKTLMIFFISTLLGVSIAMACSEIATNLEKDLTGQGSGDASSTSVGSGQSTVDPNANPSGSK